MPELLHIQEYYGLSDFYIFQSSEMGYHVVCFDKLPIHKLIELMKWTSVDPRYIEAPHYEFNTWVLRISPKNNKNIKFHSIIKSEHDMVHEKSNAHMKLCNLWFNMKIDYPNKDDNTKITIMEYKI